MGGGCGDGHHSVGNEETKRPGLEVVKDPEREKDPNVRQTYAEVVKKVSWKEETAATETTAAAETQLLSLKPVSPKSNTMSTFLSNKKGKRKCFQIGFSILLLSRSYNQSFWSSTDISSTVQTKIEHTNSSDCQRSCPNGRPNLLVYSYGNRAGISDRTWIISHLTELAGYLCATVRVPRPAALLAKKHNHEKFVNESLGWGDFYSWKFSEDGSLALFDLEGDEAVIQQWKSSQLQPELYKKWIEQAYLQESPKYKNMTFLVSSENATIRENFDVARSIAFRTTTKGSSSATFTTKNDQFLWIIHQNFYDLKGPLHQHLNNLAQNHSNISSTSTLPWIKKKCSPYCSREPWNPRTSERLEKIGTQIWDDIVRQYSDPLEGGQASAFFGTWHVRRGDTKHVCDTSIERLKEYANCTFANTEGLGRPIVLLFHTDEDDYDYNRQIKEVFQQQGLQHVRIVFLEQIVKDHLKSMMTGEENPDRGNGNVLSKAYLNNYHIFAVIKSMASKPCDFRLEHRRHISCKDCFNLFQKLAKK